MGLWGKTVIPQNSTHALGLLGDGGIGADWSSRLFRTSTAVYTQNRHKYYGLGLSSVFVCLPRMYFFSSLSCFFVLSACACLSEVTVTSYSPTPLVSHRGISNINQLPPHGAPYCQARAGIRRLCKMELELASKAQRKARRYLTTRGAGGGRGGLRGISGGLGQEKDVC